MLTETGVQVIGACVDDLEDARKVAEPLGFPVAWGVTRQIADTIDAFWNERGGFIEPTEFLVRGDGKVLASTYSSGPVGRMDPAEVIALVQILERRRREKAGG